MRSKRVPIVSGLFRVKHGTVLAHSFGTVGTHLRCANRARPEGQTIVLLFLKGPGSSALRLSSRNLALRSIGLQLESCRPHKDLKRDHSQTRALWRSPPEVVSAPWLSDFGRSCLGRRGLSWDPPQGGLLKQQIVEQRHTW